MPRPPKDPTLRQRRNRIATRAKLPAEPDVKPDAPELPRRPCLKCSGKRRPAARRGPARRRRVRKVRTRKTMPACRACSGSGRQAWHEQTLAWWAAIWASPMSTQWVTADRRALFRLAMLEEDFWRAADPKVRKEIGAEIRMQEQRFGLTPLDRRRLDWEVMRPSGPDETEIPVPPPLATAGRSPDDVAEELPSAPRPAVDPRFALRAVK